MQIKEQVSPHVSPLVLKASAEMTTPSVKWLLPLYCSLHVLCWMFLLFSFCFVWNKITIFNMHHIIKTKMNVIDITYVFCCCNVHIVFVYCKKKVVNILWIMHELCQCLIFFFLNFYFKILLWNPFVFPTCFLHYFSFEKNPSWFITYNVVTSMLV